MSHTYRIESKMELKETFTDMLFLSKIVNLKTDLYLKIEDWEKTENFKNNYLDDLIYYIEIELDNKIVVLVSYHQKNNNISDYKNIYYFLEKSIKSNKKIFIKKIQWKNQYIVSSLIDFYTGGLIDNTPPFMESLNRNKKLENILNEKIFNLVNEWLKFYGNNKINENKINYLTK